MMNVLLLLFNVIHQSFLPPVSKPRVQRLSITDVWRGIAYDVLFHVSIKRGMGVYV